MTTFNLCARVGKTGKASFGTLVPSGAGQSFSNMPRNRATLAAIHAALGQYLGVSGADPEIEYARAVELQGAGKLGVSVEPGYKPAARNAKPAAKQDDGGV